MRETIHRLTQDFAKRRAEINERISKIQVEIRVLSAEKTNLVDELEEMGRVDNEMQRPAEAGRVWAQ